MLQQFLRPKRFKTKEDFFFEFFQNPEHSWIANDRYIKSNFEEFFSLVPLNILRELYGQGDIWFIPSSGKFSCAIQPIRCSIVMVFPEFHKMLRSFSPDDACAVLAHELGHIFYKHSDRKLDVLEAQVEADKFAIDLGFGRELESFLNTMPEGLEKRVRLSYLTSRHFEAVLD